MHPKQICADVQSMGSKLVLDGTDLFIENPENIYPELEQLAKSYKSRIVTYLQGAYSDKDHNVKQTIDKIILYYLDIEQETNSRIKNWLNEDEEALQSIMKILVLYWKNGWRDIHEPVANFENEETDKLAKEIYDRAMEFFKKGAAAG